MKYRLVIPTCGRPGLLEETLASFAARVRPRPFHAVIVDDSGDPAYRRYLDSLLSDLDSLAGGWSLVSHPLQQGFCETVADGFALAAEPGVDWVYWLEDDFRHLRTVDLTLLANVLAYEPKIAQMGLMRQAVNDRERAAGGLYKMNRDRYTPMGSGPVAWLRSRTNFSTTVSLMRRSFIEENPWPPYSSECEGRYSIDLLDRGYEFAVWGVGDPWVHHTGTVRTGKGY